MAHCNDDRWLRLIGLQRESTELLEALALHNISMQEAEVKVYDNDTKLYNLYDKGISFTFIKDKLDSIDFYQRDHKFKPVDPSIQLPFGITPKTTGEAIVAKFGEPKDKGGGITTKMDIWLRYSHLQVELDERSWDAAQHAVWKAITLF